MSSIKKSASFRSRIPVRRTKPMARRCYSPPPSSTAARTITTTASASANNQHQYSLQQQPHRQSGSKSREHPQYPYHNINQYYPEHQHKWMSSHGASHAISASNKCATYSSSSYSSGDESQESDAPAQYLLKKSSSSSSGASTKNSLARRPLNVSTDAMSLDALLDSISCGSFSSSPSPANCLDDNRLVDHHSSYDSLDKYNYALETLKLTDNHNYNSQNVSHPLAINSCMLRPKCRQPYVHNGRDCDDGGLLPPPPPLPKQQQSHPKLSLQQQQLQQRSPRVPITSSSSSLAAVAAATSHPDDKANQIFSREMAKQQQLSDWYYIKSNPKSPRLPPRPEKRTVANGNAKYSPALQQRENCVRNNSSTNIYNTLSNNNNNISDNGSLKRERYDGHVVGNDGEDNTNGKFIANDANADVPASTGNLANQMAVKFASRCDEREINGIGVTGSCAASLVQQSLDRKRREHREQSPIYQHIHQHAPMQQAAYVHHATEQQLSPQQQHRLMLTNERKVPDYENHPIVANFHHLQLQQSPNANYSPRNRTAVNDHHHNNNVNNNNNNRSINEMSLPLPHQTPMAMTGYGELMTTSSFPHVNVSSFIPEMTSSSSSTIEKQYRSTSNFANQSEYVDEQRTRMLPIPPRKRALPPISFQPSPNQTLYPPKSTSYRSECELFGSYVSLECPSPPGPPACVTESRRDPQARLSRHLKLLYTELALKEPIVPQWAHPTAPGALCPARLEPDFRLHSQSHGFNDCLSVDQLLAPVQTKDGQILEAPRRLLIESPHWAARSFLALRILHAWAKQPPWPTRGTPVALALFIPLAELNHKKTFAHYIEKELLTKGPNNPFATFGGFSSAWNSLTALGPKLLIVLDGYDSIRGPVKRKNKNVSQDVVDLLEGKLFPEARIIIISVTPNVFDVLPLVQRHVKYEGLTWGRSASLLGGGQWGAPSRLLDTVQSCIHLRNVARTPLGCLALASVYVSSNGDMPTEEIDVVESVLNCVAADSSQTNVAELGRLALFALKTKRSAVTTAEIKMYCSNPESSVLASLDKALLFGKTAKKKNEYFYTPICAGVAEFLAANYVASLANRPGLLASEIMGLSLSDEVEPEILKVLTFAMGLLASRAHILLSKLTPLWLSPQNVFSLALGGGDSPANMNALCDLLGISKTPPVSPLETNPIWVQIRSTPNELLGWAMALKSPNCSLKNLELSYQFEKQLLHDSRNSVEVFLDALSMNESVSTMRITSLIENDAKEAEINIVANCVARALLKPRLENFELILTLLEEDPPALKLQMVVTALCRSLPKQSRLNCLSLDLSLCTSQLVQICSTLEKCPHVTRLSLPHLRCERGAIAALASLLSARPLTSLALPSCWGVRDDPPSSSGVSMGSGSGSSTGTGLSKQSTLTGAPSPRSYPTGLFSSLPRGALAPSSTMGRSATLPRQPMDCPPDKRSSDSVVSKTWYPTPACDGGPHNSGTLHDLLLAAREPYSRLHGLDLSKAQLSLEDSMCLGETVRLSNQLHSIKIEGSSRISEVLPAVLGAGESTSLQMMSLASPRLILEDGATAMAAKAISNCVTLRLLNIDGWSFRIENSSTLSAIRIFLSFTSVREIGLSNCRLLLPNTKVDAIPSADGYECRSVVVLKMAGAQVVLADNNILRGPQLLPYLCGFSCLRELDLSAPSKSSLGSSSSTPFILDDKCITGFFQSLHTHFSMLNTLKMCNWILHTDDSSKTLKSVSKSLRNSPLCHVKLDGITIMDRPKKTRIEPQFIHMVLSSLLNLRWLGISLGGKKDEQITAIGNAVLDIRGHEIDIRLSESTIEQARQMAQAITLDNKFDVRVSTFGTSSGILVHAEKPSTKSLSRRH